MLAGTKRFTHRSYGGTLRIIAPATGDKHTSLTGVTDIFVPLFIGRVIVTFTWTVVVAVPVNPPAFLFCLSDSRSKFAWFGV